jgi:cobalt-zinc-cadmium efflux system outer membrane protein
MRTRIAAGQLAETETRVADEILKVVAEVKTAFYTAQARNHLLGRLRVLSQTNETAAEFTKRLHDAGNVSDLDLANQQSAYEQSHLEIAKRADPRRDRERVNRLLGLSGNEINHHA